MQSRKEEMSSHCLCFTGLASRTRQSTIRQTGIRSSSQPKPSNKCRWPQPKDSSARSSPCWVSWSWVKLKQAQIRTKSQLLQRRSSSLRKNRRSLQPRRRARGQRKRNLLQWRKRPETTSGCCRNSPSPTRTRNTSSSYNKCRKCRNWNCS